MDTPRHATTLIRRRLIWRVEWPALWVMVERLVPDELWELFQRVVPPAPARPQGGGRRRYGPRSAGRDHLRGHDRLYLAAAAAGLRAVGADRTRRFAECSTARVWAKLHRVVLDELGSRGGLDWSSCAIDSVNTGTLKEGS